MHCCRALFALARLSYTGITSYTCTYAMNSQWDNSFTIFTQKQSEWTVVNALMLVQDDNGGRNYQYPRSEASPGGRLLSRDL